MQWDIHDPVTEEVVSAWFRGTYTGPTKDSNPVTGKHHHLIHYDARDSFPAATCECIFLSNSRLFDCAEEDGMMLWRHEGSPWIADVKDEEFGASLLEEEGGTKNKTEVTMTMSDLLADQERMDAAEHGGNSLADMGLRAMSTLPYMQQVKVVSDYKDFATAFKEKLASIQNVRGSGALVTADDIKDFMSELKRN